MSKLGITKTVLFTELAQALGKTDMNAEAGTPIHNFITRNAEYIVGKEEEYAALVEACHGLLGAYSNGEFEPSMRLPLVVMESALKIAKIARTNVEQLITNK